MLQAWCDGDRDALEHTLQTSALVNEAYVRLNDRKSVRRQNRAHFFGVEGDG
ncbi:MAG TPA: ECF-type sigma factor [Pyrinomonadaceae bacterium]